MTDVYSDTQYSIKKPKCQGENLTGCNLSGRKDKMSSVTQGSWKCLIFLFAILVFLIFIYSLQLHLSRKEEGEANSTTDVAKETLLLSDERDFFLMG